jgi:hypothetical protein
MRIDGYETADQLTEQCSSQPLIGSAPALGISANAARRVIRDWMRRKHKELRESISWIRAC